MSTIDTENLLFDGPVGQLEAILETPADAELSAIAVVCHPHPLHEGTMHNKVAHTLARTFVQLGAAALRFNFRGVGKSEGEHANAIGEVDDARAAVAFMRERWPQLPLWLGGFSFGAQVSLAAASSLEPEWVVSVAPPVPRMNLADFTAPRCSWLLIQGGADEVVDPQAVADWARSVQPAPQFEWIEDAGHFFHGKLNIVREIISRHSPRQGNA